MIVTFRHTALCQARIWCALVLCTCLLCLAGPARAVDTLDYNQLMDYVAGQKGRVTLVNFWATWCGPCLKEMPSLKRLRSTVPEQKLHVVGISLDFDPSAVDKFLARKPLNYPVFVAGPDLMNLMRIRSIPKTLLYDSEGFEVVNHDGYMSMDALCAKVRSLLPDLPECDKGN